MKGVKDTAIWVQTPGGWKLLGDHLSIHLRYSEENGWTMRSSLTGEDRVTQIEATSDIAATRAAVRVIKREATLIMNEAQKLFERYGKPDPIIPPPPPKVSIPVPEAKPANGKKVRPSKKRILPPLPPREE